MEKKYVLESNSRNMLQIRSSKKDHKNIMLKSGEKSQPLSEKEFEAYQDDCETYKKGYKLKVLEQEAKHSEGGDKQEDDSNSDAVNALKEEKKELQKQLKALPTESKVERASIKDRVKEINKEIKELGA